MTKQCQHKNNNRSCGDKEPRLTGDGNGGCDGRNRRGDGSFNKDRQERDTGMHRKEERVARSCAGGGGDRHPGLKSPREQTGETTSCTGVGLVDRGLEA